MPEVPDLSAGVRQLYPFDLPASTESDIGPTIYCVVCGMRAPVEPFGDNIREGGRCSSCKSWNRRRAHALILLQALSEIAGTSFTSIADERIPGDIAIYGAETVSATHNLMQRLKGYKHGEFLGPGWQSGDVLDGVQHQDLTATSFADNTFDVVLTCDVFEHIVEPYLAHQEIYRILKPGGRHIFTLPSNPNELLDIQTALVTSAGIEYLAQPEYHGEPLDQNLVYNVVGFEMLVELRAMGYEATAFHIDDPALGILGPGTQVYQVRKAFEPSTRPVPFGRRHQSGARLADAKQTPSQSVITAILVTDGDQELITRCLHSLITASDMADQLDAIVFDNASAEKLDVGVEGIRYVRVSERVDLDEAFRQGVRYAETDLVLLVTQEMVFEDGFLKPLLDEVQRDGGPDSATPTVLRRSGEDWEPGTTGTFANGTGICYLLKTSSPGKSCAHVEQSITVSDT